MTEMTPSPPPILRADGTIVGLSDLTAPAMWGALQPWQEGDQTRYAMEIDMTSWSPAEIEKIDAARIAAAVEAAVAANCDVAVHAHVEGVHVPTTHRPSGRRVIKSVTASWNNRVLAKDDPESVQRAAEAAAVVLNGGRPAELYQVYLLGVRAMQSIAPVVGLWAFSSVIEEAGTEKDSLKHALDLAAKLRAQGFQLPPNPQRRPAAIRAAALHATPKSPMPTLDEVAWFRDVARAYLADMAGAQRSGP